MKLAPGGWEYFAKEIATGREDYYAADTDHAGRYVGRGAELLGLAHEAVTAAALERLIGHGTHPRDGSPLGHPFPTDNEQGAAR